MLGNHEYGPHPSDAQRLEKWPTFARAPIVAAHASEAMTWRPSVSCPASRLQEVLWRTLALSVSDDFGVRAADPVRCPELGVLSNWVMDSRYFSKRVAVGSGHFISFIFLDTSPCVAAYRADDQHLA